MSHSRGRDPPLPQNGPRPPWPVWGRGVFLFTIQSPLLTESKREARKSDWQRRASDGVFSRPFEERPRRSAAETPCPRAGPAKGGRGGAGAALLHREAATQRSRIRPGRDEPTRRSAAEET